MIIVYEPEDEDHPNRMYNKDKSSYLDFGSGSGTTFKCKRCNKMVAMGFEFFWTYQPGIYLCPECITEDDFPDWFKEDQKKKIEKKTTRLILSLFLPYPPCVKCKWHGIGKWLNVEGKEMYGTNLHYCKKAEQDGKGYNLFDGGKEVKRCKNYDALVA